MKILSYNLRHHRASGELPRLVEDYEPDVVCVQEAYADALPSHAAGLELAATTATGLLGQGVYVRAERFAVTASRAFRLKPGLHDLLLLPATERLLAVRLVDRRSGERMTVASFHAAPLTATNMLRRHQVSAAHMLLDELGAGEPVAMIGDFNYPLFRGSLVRRAARDGYTVSVSDEPTYRHTDGLSTHFDLLTTRGLRVDGVRTLPAGASDHRPILAEATIRETTIAAATAAAPTRTAANRRRARVEPVA